MNFIGGKQNTEIHSNKTKPQGFMFKPWAYASWTMLTGLQATCTHAHKPSGHMQAHAQKPSGCMHASSPKGFCKLQPRQQAHERLQHVESQAWFTIVQRHVPYLFGLSGSFCVATATSLATHHAFSVHRAMAGYADFGLVWEGMGFKLLGEGMDKAWLCALLQCKVCLETVQAAKDEIQSQEVSTKQKDQSL